MKKNHTLVLSDGLESLLYSFFFVIVSVDNIRKNTATSPGTYEVSNVAEIEGDNTTPTYAPPVKAIWHVYTWEDAMTDTRNVKAEITSENYISQDFPYEGKTRATITVRYMKKYGNDVLIGVSQGQIHGSKYNGENYITARFDEGSPKRYYFNEAADGSSDVVFISNHSEFIKRCKQANDIMIELPIWQEGRPIFSFHIDEPLVWPVE